MSTRQKVITILFASVLISFLFLSIFCKGIEGLGGGNKLEGRKEDIKQNEVANQTQREGGVKKQNLIKEEPELIWQKDFGEKIRQAKLHKTIDVSDFPVMAVETENNLFIFDKKENEKIKRPIPMLEFEEKGKKEIAIGFAIVSDNGEYVLEGKGIPEFSYDLKYTTVVGKTLWKKKDFHGVAEVSPDGSLVVLLDTKGWEEKKGNVKFYDSSGNLLKQHPMDLSSILIPLYKFSFSDNGNYSVLRIEQWTEDRKGRKAIYPVILFDRKGNLLWQKNIEVTPGKTPIFELLISPYGNRISYSSDKQIYTVNKKGNLLWKKENYGILSFSNKENLLIKSKKVLLVNGLLGTEIRNIDLGLFSTPHMVLPKISPDESLVAILTTGETVGDKEILYVLNLLGEKPKIIFRRAYPANFIRQFHFSTDRRVLYFVGQEETKLSVYRLVFLQ